MVWVLSGLIGFVTCINWYCWWKHPIFWTNCRLYLGIAKMIWHTYATNFTWNCCWISITVSYGFLVALWLGFDTSIEFVTEVTYSKYYQQYMYNYNIMPVWIISFSCIEILPHTRIMTKQKAFPKFEISY